MSMIDDDCELCFGACTPWRCGSCGETNCSYHEEECARCRFPRLHRFRDLNRLRKLREEVDAIFHAGKPRGTE